MQKYSKRIGLSMYVAAAILCSLSAKGSMAAEAHANDASKGGAVASGVSSTPSSVSGSDLPAERRGCSSPAGVCADDDTKKKGRETADSSASAQAANAFANFWLGGQLSLPAPPKPVLPGE